ncbi:MAG TPA: hypothetical protein PKD94_16645, partial [Ignavibacteria bacterium]|nr:hypothetical protein [Ignavibacteria bacterium]
KDFGQRVIAVLTDMSSPLGYAIGNWSEIKECIEIMDPAINKSPQSKDLVDIVLLLASAMLLVAGKTKTFEEGIIASSEKLLNGECFDKFISLVKLQGGDIKFIKNTSLYPEAKFTEVIRSKDDGYVSKLDALTFGLAAVNLGCGRKTVEDKIDYSSAVLLDKKIGDKVNKDDIICRIYGETDVQVSSTKKMLQKGIKISKVKPEIKTRLIEVIN